MFRVVTANIKCKPHMPQAHVVSDVRKAARGADVVLWQEIGIARYKQAVRGLGGKWDHFFPNGPGYDQPISWRTDIFAFEHAGVYLLHRGRADYAPDRGITWVQLKHLGTGQHIIFHSVHYVARAWHTNGSPALRSDARIAAQQPGRQAMWLEGRTRHGTVLDEWVAAGLPVIGGGDFNRGGRFPVVGNFVSGRKVRYIDVAGGLDYIFSLDGKQTRIKRVKAKNTHGHSDHPFKSVDVRLKRRRRFRRK